MLNEDCRLNMIENYPILDNLDIWRCFGLKKVPNKSMYTINNLVFKCIHIMNSFLSANIDKESFIIMVKILYTYLYYFFQLLHLLVPNVGNIVYN